MTMTTEEKIFKANKLINDISRDAENKNGLLTIGENLVRIMGVQSRKEDLGTLGVKCVLRLSIMPDLKSKS